MTKKKNPGDPPKTRPPVKRPRNLEKAISCAYLRSLGASQEHAAQTAGASIRQLREWEHTEWWPQVCAEAHRRWLAGVTEGTKRGILKALNDPREYGPTSRWAAERLMPEFKAKSAHELSGPDGGPLITKIVSEVVFVKPGEPK
jgi:hypothetical protein